MKDKTKDIVFYVIVMIIFVLVGVMFVHETEYNNEMHSDDVNITEWVSPDGVHYWYEKAGYHAVLAPRYDSDGNLVIDRVSNEDKKEGE